MTTRVWLVLPDPFSARLFLDTGIVDELRKRAGERLTLVLDADEQTAHWKDRADGATVVDLPELTELLETEIGLTLAQEDSDGDTGRRLHQPLADLVPHPPRAQQRQEALTARTGRVRDAGRPT